MTFIVSVLPHCFWTVQAVQLNPQLSCGGSCVGSLRAGEHLVVFFFFEEGENIFHPPFPPIFPLCNGSK